MIANVSAHRRANAFAQALEEQSDQGTAAEQSEGSAPAPAAAEQTEQGRLLALATGLAELPRPELDPEVKVVQRAQLVAAMEAMLLESAGGGADSAVPEQRSHRARGAHRASGLGKLRPRSRLTKGLAAGGLSVGVAAGAFGGVAAASGDALPGDSLYGLKRGIEDFKRGLADGDSERGRVYLDQASTRLNEARRLMERDRSGPLDHETLGEVRRALSGMHHDASEGHRLLAAAYAADPDSLGPMQALAGFSRSHRETWGALRDRLPVQLGDVGEQVTSVFDAIDEDVAPLESLLPETPSESGGSGKHRGAPESASTGSSGADRSTAPSSGSSASDGRGSSSSPSKSASGSTGEDEGLLGGSTGGLLDPPNSTGSTTPSAGDPALPEPDVTLPPLLPGLLPGLGIDTEDAD
ncbi:MULTISPECIES: DUF5667 domain-containing protein [Streptomyces]|uniref:DUF5667 domain-containing protein n=1 Tax=Streptomyces fuscus TaxID=3048495 RepID=A0ABT7J999_9ACTN|nr:MULTISPECIES: DUF5667 domain-containing protein [Streptomyces]MCM1977041.1 DUF5667 domain-containing protein [Streptomyces sp. G1]MDL2081427.1 DUF5667 domain-containing protein [Streptomyces fuscus]SBT88487.1 hypothetical protein GA0115233_10039 [Streptomyces sp. DI166]